MPVIHMPNKRFIFLWVFIIILFAAVLEAFAEPKQITSVQELQAMNTWEEYILMNDIDAIETASWNSGAGFVPIGNSVMSFSGRFDGNGNVIRNLYINSTSDYVGLFGQIAAGAEIKNVALINVNISGRNHVGALAGRTTQSISGCYSTGIVNGIENVGGLAGSGDSGIEQCYSLSIVNGETNVGGMLGKSSGPIRRCYTNSNVTGTNNVGGLFGHNEGLVENCYSRGDVDGTSKVGGCVGYNFGPVKKSYSTGIVTGSDATGGFVGDNNTMGFIENCFWDIQSSGQPLNGVGEGEIGIISGKTTSEMMQKQTFTGWDFDNVWTIINYNDYPFFKWQSSVSQPSVDLSVVITCNDTSPSLGDIITYTITITNNSQQTVTNVNIYDVLPGDIISSAKYSSDNGNTWNNWTGHLNIPSINPGQSYVVKISGTVDQSGEFNNKVDVTVDGIDINPADNSSEVKIIVATPAPPTSNLEISELSATPTTGEAPATIDFSVTASGGSGDYSFSWNFGEDNEVWNGQNLTHIYQSKGTYTVTVKVTDNMLAEYIPPGTLTVEITAPSSETGQTPNSGGGGETEGDSVSGGDDGGGGNGCFISASFL